MALLPKAEDGDAATQTDVFVVEPAQRLQAGESWSGQRAARPGWLNLQDPAAPRLRAGKEASAACFLRSSSMQRL